MIALSFSRIRDMACPWRFYRLYIAKDYKEPETHAMRVGTECHRVMADYRVHCLLNRLPMDVEWLWRAADGAEDDEVRAIISTVAKSPLAIMPPVMAEPMVERRLAFNQKLELLEDEHWATDAVAFRCIADFCYVADETVVIVDDKTGWSEPDRLQLDLYSYFVPLALSRPVKAVRTIFNDLRRGESLVVDEVAIDDTQRTRIPDLIYEWIDEICSWQEYPATPCALCAYCTVPGCVYRDFTERALIMAENSPLQVIPTEIVSKEQAENVLLFIDFAETKLSAIKEMLRAWVEAHGPVTVAGKTAELRPNNPWKAKDLKGLASALISYGVPKEAVWDAMSLSESDLEKLAKKVGIEDRLSSLLQAYGERKTYKPRFGIFKARSEF